MVSSVKIADKGDRIGYLGRPGNDDCSFQRNPSKAQMALE